MNLWNNSVEIEFFYYISKNVVNEVTLTAGRRQEGENYNNVQKLLALIYLISI